MLTGWYFKQKDIKQIVQEYILESSTTFPKSFYLFYLKNFLPIHSDQNILHYVALSCRKTTEKKRCLDMANTLVKKSYFINWDSEGVFNLTPFQISLIYCDKEMIDYFLSLEQLYTGPVKYGQFKEYQPWQLVERSRNCSNELRKEILETLKSYGLEKSYF